MSAHVPGEEPAEAGRVKGRDSDFCGDREAQPEAALPAFRDPVLLEAYERHETARRALARVPVRRLLHHVGEREGRDQLEVELEDGSAVVVWAKARGGKARLALSYFPPRPGR